MKKALLLPLILSVLLASCSSGSSFTKNSVESTTESSWTMRYELFDGNRTMTVRLDAGAEFSVEIVSEEGALGLSITDADGTEFYTGSELPTSAFTVRAEGSGPYSVRFEADHHSGSFTVTWKEIE